MPNKNEIRIEGHLGQSPDVRYTANGTKVVNISVATSYKRSKDAEPETTWHRIVAYGYCADQLEHAVKGEPVHVTGRIQHRQWTDKNGNSKTSTEIVAESAYRINWQRVDREPAEDGAPRPRHQEAAAPERFDDGEDIPF